MSETENIFNTNADAAFDDSACNDSPADLLQDTHFGNVLGISEMHLANGLTHLPNGQDNKKRSGNAARIARWKDRKEQSGLVRTWVPAEIAEAIKAGTPVFIGSQPSQQVQPIQLSADQRRWLGVGKYMDGVAAWKARLVCWFVGLKWTE